VRSSADTRERCWGKEEGQLSETARNEIIQFADESPALQDTGDIPHCSHVGRLKKHFSHFVVPGGPPQVALLPFPLLGPGRGDREFRGKRWRVGPAQTAPPICKPVSGPRLQNGPSLVSAAPDRTAACAMLEHQTDSCQPDGAPGQTRARLAARQPRARSRCSLAFPVSEAFAPALSRLNHRRLAGAPAGLLGT